MKMSDDMAGSADEDRCPCGADHQHGAVLAYGFVIEIDTDHRIGTQKKFANRTEYSMGELEAEIFSAFLAVHLGFEPHFDQTAAYVEGWLKALKDDKNAIFKAAAEAR